MASLRSICQVTNQQPSQEQKVEPETSEDMIKAAEARLAELANSAEPAESGSYAESVEVSRTLSPLKSIEAFGFQKNMTRDSKCQ
jgi:hypothetical protein